MTFFRHPGKCQHFECVISGWMVPGVSDVFLLFGNILHYFLTNFVDRPSHWQRALRPPRPPRSSTWGWPQQVWLLLPEFYRNSWIWDFNFGWLKSVSAKSDQTCWCIKQRWRSQSPWRWRGLSAPGPPPHGAPPQGGGLSPTPCQVWPLLISLCLLCLKKNIDCLVGKIFDPSSGKKFFFILSSNSFVFISDSWRAFFELPYRPNLASNITFVWN